MAYLQQRLMNTLMTTNKKYRHKEYGSEAPTLKDFLIVLLVVAVLIALDWVAYFKLGWFH